MSETTSEPNQVIECFYRSYERWLGLERDPHDLLITYSSEPMTMWPISTRVNKPDNDDPPILDRTAEPLDWQAPLEPTSSALRA